MRSEIPQLEVVTAISDADCEDFVSQLLFSQGWSIIYRAIDMASLENFLSSRGGSLRTVVIFKRDLPDFNVDSLAALESFKVTQISLDGIETNSHKLMTHIRSQLRLPLIVQSPEADTLGRLNSSETRAIPVKQPCVITLTGTVGSPGRSSIALNLSNYLAASSPVQIFDADTRAPALEYLTGRALNLNQALKFVDLSSSESRSEKKIADNSKLNIVDLGSLPPLDEVVNDRRWQAGFINSTLEETTTLIYLCKSNGLSLIRLEKFMGQFPVLLRKIPIIYILNQSGNTREDRALATRFSKMTTGEKSFTLPRREDINSNLAAPAKRENSFSKAIAEIGRIAQEVQEFQP